jgi:integrase
VWVAAETGGRRGETLALRWSGVDFETGTVSIDGTESIGDDGSQLRSTTKTKKSRRIGVSSISLAYLRDHRDRVEGLLSIAASEPVEAEPGSLVFSGGRGSPP